MIIMQYGYHAPHPAWVVHQTRAPQYLRIYLVEGGSVVYRDALTSFPLRNNHLYVFPSQRGYDILQEAEDPLVCTFMHASVSTYIVQNPIEICPIDFPDLADTLRLWRRQFDDPQRNSACIDAFSAAIVQLLIRDGLIHKRIDSSLVPPDLDPFSASVASMSRRTGYTQEHFIRHFTKTAGITPYQYIVTQRMNAAIALMRQGITLEEIAARVGYASAKSFSGAFKRRFGMPPDVYRLHFMRQA